MLLLTYALIGCAQGDKQEDLVVCKEISYDLNATFLNEALSPIEKDVKYILIKDKFLIQPIGSGEVTLNIEYLDITSDSIFDCVSIIQDKDDTVNAEINLAI